VQRQFDACVAPAPEQAAGDHLGVVDDQRVARPEQGREIAHRLVRDPARSRAGHGQEPRAVPRFGGIVRDQGLGQVEIEIVGFHRGRI